MAHGNIGLIQPYMFDPKIDSEEVAERIINARCIRMVMRFMHHSLQPLTHNGN